MKNLRQIIILISFFCIWLTSLIKSEHETILGFFLILSFGILHGSNDIFLISRIQTSKVSASFGRILSFYVLFVLLTCGMFYFFPIVALAIFIVCSGYHFGEQHWENEVLSVNNVLKRILYVSYGMFILSLLFWLNSEEVIKIVTAISGSAVSKITIEYLFYTNLTILALVWIFFGVKDKVFRRKTLAELLYLVVFAIIFKTSSLIWGFAIYFIFWHSLPSLHDQIHFLYDKVDKKGIIDYLKTAFPFWMISVAGILALYYVFRDRDIFYALFFSFLAAVTFPHSLAIHEMFKRKKSEDDEF